MAETNPYAALEREKSSPSVTEQEVLATPVSGRTSEASPALRVRGGRQQGRVGVGRTAPGGVGVMWHWKNGRALFLCLHSLRGAA